MVAFRWVKDDAGYEEWVASHPKAFQANLYNPPRGTYFKIHRATCKLPDRSKPGSKHPRTGNRYSKLTANTITELTAWAKANLPSLKRLSEVHYCKTCPPSD